MIRNTKPMTPAQHLAEFIKMVDAMNAIERSGMNMNNDSHTGIRQLRHEFVNAPYSIEWDSECDRWTLVAEMDTAIPVCSFNQMKDECTEIDKCAGCRGE